MYCTDENLKRCDAAPVSGMEHHFPLRDGVPARHLCLSHGVHVLKSLYFRAISGLWSAGDGSVRRYPDDRTIYIPQV